MNWIVATKSKNEFGEMLTDCKTFETYKTAMQWAEEQVDHIHSLTYDDGFHEDECVIVARIRHAYVVTDVTDEIGEPPEEYGFKYWGELRDCKSEKEDER